MYSLVYILDYCDIIFINILLLCIFMFFSIILWGLFHNIYAILAFSENGFGLLHFYLLVCIWWLKQPTSCLNNEKLCSQLEIQNLIMCRTLLHKKFTRIHGISQKAKTANKLIIHWYQNSGLFLSRLFIYIFIFIYELWLMRSAGTDSYHILFWIASFSESSLWLVQPERVYYHSSTPTMHCHTIAEEEIKIYIIK